MRLREFIFGKTKLAKQFDKTLSVAIKTHDRVRHRNTRESGTVLGTAIFKTKLGDVPVLTIRYDDGKMAYQVPAEEFTKWTRY